MRACRQGERLFIQPRKILRVHPTRLFFVLERMGQAAI
jgi:hypothetical protein